MQVQGQRGVGDPPAVLIERRQAGVSPAQVRRYPVEKKVELVWVLPVRGRNDTIQGQGAHRDIPDGGRYVVVDQTVVQEVPEHGRNRPYGERVAQDPPPLRSLR
jgi:hypothetical protein